MQLLRSTYSEGKEGLEALFTDSTSNQHGRASSSINKFYKVVLEEMLGMTNQPPFSLTCG